MNFISLLLFSISTNLDNIPVGISYSLKNKKRKLTDILKISFFTSFITFIIMLIGTNISHILPFKLANNIGSIILILIGSYSLIKKYILTRNSNLSFNEKNEENLSILKIILLLSINNLATGLSASIAGINYISSSILTFIFGIIFLYMGAFIGGKINSSKLEEYSNYLSSFIILLLGIIEVLFNK